MILRQVTPSDAGPAEPFGSLACHLDIDVNGPEIAVPLPVISEVPASQIVENTIAVQGRFVAFLEVKQDSVLEALGGDGSYGGIIASGFDFKLDSMASQFKACPATSTVDFPDALGP